MLSRLGIAPMYFKLAGWSNKSLRRCSCSAPTTLQRYPWHYLRCRKTVKQRHNRQAKTLQRESRKAGMYSLTEVSGVCADASVQMDIVNLAAASNGHELIDVTITAHCSNVSHPSIDRVQKNPRSAASDREKSKHTQQCPPNRIGPSYELRVNGIQEHGALGLEAHETVRKIIKYQAQKIDCSCLYTALRLSAGLSIQAATCLLFLPADSALLMYACRSWCSGASERDTV